jgi:tetratricopeptide (TPR) repeat protein
MYPIDRRKAIILGALILLTVAAYSSALSNEFVGDDRVYILDKPEFLQITNLSLVLDNNLYFKSFKESSWRPLVTVSHFFNVALFGYWAPGHNAFDLLLYIVVVLLVYWSAVRIGMGSMAAFIAAALFSVHPVHVEAVVVSSLRADVLCVAFILTAFLCLVQAEEKERGSRWWVGALVFYALGLLAKEVAIVFPLIVAAYDVARSENRWSLLKTKTIGRRYGGLLGVTGVYALLRFGLYAGPYSGMDYLGGTWLSAMLTTLGILVQYTSLLLFPLQLKAIYVVKPLDSLAEPLAMLGLVIIVIMVLATFEGYRRRSVLGFCLAWIFITLLPVANLYPIYNPMGERYLFFPSIGLCWALGFLANKGIDRVAARRKPVLTFIAWTAVGTVIIGLGLRTALQTRVWKDDLTLYRETAAVSPDSYRAFLGLGSAYAREGQYSKAIEAYERSIALKPDHPDHYYSLGFLYMTLAGETEVGQERETYSQKAISFFEASLERDPNDAQALINLAKLHQELGKFAEAERALVTLTRVRPEDGKAFQWLAEVAIQNNSWVTVQGALERLVELDPTQLEAWNALVQLYVRQGRIQKGLSTAQRASAANPTNSEFHFQQGVLFVVQGKNSSALKAFKRVVELNPEDPRAHRNLGVLYLKSRVNSRTARHHFQKFLQLAPDHPEAENVRLLLKEIGAPE